MTSMEEGIQWLLRWGAMEWSGSAGILPMAALAQADMAVHQASKRQAPTYARLEFSTAREHFTGAQNAMQGFFASPLEAGYTRDYAMGPG